MSLVLVVDDSGVIRKATRRMLEGLGHEVIEADDGTAAQTTCRSTTPDLILLDWNMPNMDGLTFLKWLRGQVDAVQPKVIFCTTESDFSNIRAALSAGAEEYIFKPFDQETLEGKLAMVGVGA